MPRAPLVDLRVGVVDEALSTTLPKPMEPTLNLIAFRAVASSLRPRRYSFLSASSCRGAARAYRSFSLPPVMRVPAATGHEELSATPLVRPDSGCGRRVGRRRRIGADHSASRAADDALTSPLPSSVRASRTNAPSERTQLFHARVSRVTPSSAGVIPLPAPAMTRCAQRLSCGRRRAVVSSSGGVGGEEAL